MTTTVELAQEVWAQEVAYWEYLKTGDMDRFMALWHDEVIAWPNNQPSPADKSAVYSLRSDLLAKIDLTAASVEITPRSVQVYGDVGIVYYELHLVPAAGQGQPIHNRMVHVWQRTAGGWQIIGGMSAPLANT